MIDQHFENAVDKLLKHEGGYVDDPADKGGETNFGISKAVYLDLDIKNLTRDEAKEIYFRDYWQKNRYGDINNQKIAEKVFDLAVNMGSFRANCLLQIAVNYAGTPVVIDGMIGPQTLSAVNGQVSGYLLALLKIEAVRFYASLENARHEKGWVKRAVS